MTWRVRTTESSKSSKRPARRWCGRNGRQMRLRPSRMLPRKPQLMRLRNAEVATSSRRSRKVRLGSCRTSHGSPRTATRSWWIGSLRRSALRWDRNRNPHRSQNARRNPNPHPNPHRSQKPEPKPEIGDDVTPDGEDVDLVDNSSELTELPRTGSENLPVLGMSLLLTVGGIGALLARRLRVLRN